MEHRYLSSERKHPHSTPNWNGENHYRPPSDCKRTGEWKKHPVSLTDKASGQPACPIPFSVSHHP